MKPILKTNLDKVVENTRFMQDLNKVLYGAELAMKLLDVAEGQTTKIMDEILLGAYSSLELDLNTMLSSSDNAAGSLGLKPHITEGGSGSPYYTHVPKTTDSSPQYIDQTITNNALDPNYDFTDTPFIDNAGVDNPFIDNNAAFDTPFIDNTSDNSPFIDNNAASYNSFNDDSFFNNSANNNTAIDNFFTDNNAADNFYINDDSNRNASVSMRHMYQMAEKAYDSRIDDDEDLERPMKFQHKF